MSWEKKSADHGKYQAWDKLARNILLLWGRGIISAGRMKAVRRAGSPFVLGSVMWQWHQCVLGDVCAGPRGCGTDAAF